MSLDNDRIAGQDAQALLDNPVLKKAFDQLEEHLNKRELSLNTAKNPGDAADIIRCKQLLQGVKREIYNIVQTGQVAEIQLKELNKSKMTVFNRGY